MGITLTDRVKLYNDGFPKYPNLLHHKGWIHGTWMIGNLYRREHGYHGEFPPGYLKRILKMFPDKKKRLFPFSGTLDRYDGITVDVNPNLHPDVVAPVEDLPFPDGDFNLIVADPPYTKEDAKKYGYPYPSKPKCFKELSRVSEPGGFLVWLDIIVPRYRNADWILVGLIGLFTGTQRRFRVIAIFRKPGEVTTKPLW